MQLHRPRSEAGGYAVTKGASGGQGLTQHCLLLSPSAKSPLGTRNCTMPCTLPEALPLDSAKGRSALSKPILRFWVWVLWGFARMEGLAWLRGARRTEGASRGHGSQRASRADVARSCGIRGASPHTPAGGLYLPELLDCSFANTAPQQHMTSSQQQGTIRHPGRSCPFAIHVDPGSLCTFLPSFPLKFYRLTVILYSESFSIKPEACK